MEQTVGERIAELMRKNRMSQKELAISAGISQANISYYVNGSRTPNAANLVNIAKALHTTADCLLGGEAAGDPGSAFYQAKKTAAAYAGAWTPEQKTELAGLLFGRDAWDDRDLAFYQMKSAAIGYARIWTEEQKAELAGALFAER